MSEKDPIEYGKYFLSNDKLGSLFGYQIIFISKEECIIEYESKKEHNNPNGMLHGGALFTVMDSGQGAFIHYILDEKYKFGAIGTATIRYLAPVTVGKIKVKTWLKEQVKRKFVICSTAIDESGKEVATLEEIWIALLK